MNAEFRSLADRNSEGASPQSRGKGRGRRPARLRPDEIAGPCCLGSGPSSWRRAWQCSGWAGSSHYGQQDGSVRGWAGSSHYGQQDGTVWGGRGVGALWQQERTWQSVKCTGAWTPGHRGDCGPRCCVRAAVFALLCSGTGQEQLKTRSLEQENEQQQNADVEEQERGIRARRRGACRSGPCRCGHCRRGWGPGWTIAWAGESQRTGRTGLVCVKL